MCVSACQLGILGNLVLCRLMSCRPFSCYIKDATTLPLSRNNTTSLPKATYTPPRCLKIYRTRIEIESQSNRSCKRRINTSLLGLSAVDPGSQESPWMMIIASRDGTRTYLRRRRWVGDILVLLFDHMMLGYSASRKNADVGVFSRQVVFINKRHNSD